MPMYETMIITSATLDEEAGTALVQKFKNLIEANATMEAMEEWGKKRLAYPINKEDDGIYTLFHYSCDAAFPAELDRVLKITDGVLRSMIIVKDEIMEAARLDAISKAANAKAEAEKAEAARAAAKAKAKAEAEAEAEKPQPPKEQQESKQEDERPAKAEQEGEE